MRNPAPFCVRKQLRGAIDNGAAQDIHSTSAVLWDIGLVLAIFLGLTLAATATLTASGMN